MKKIKYSNLVLPAILLLIILCSILLKVFLLLNQPLDFNEGGIATIAKGINEGYKPYVDLFEHKTSLAHYTLALAFRIAGTSSFVVHFLALLFDFILLLSIFFITKKLYNYKIALFASAVYSILIQNVFYDTEIPMTFFGFIGIFLYIISFEKKNKFWPLFFSGFFIALSIWFKQPGIFFFIAILIHQLFLVYKKEIKLNQSLRRIYILLAGILVLSLPLLSYFIYTSGISNFFFSIILFNIKFSGSTSRILQIGKFIGMMLYNFGIFLAIIFSYRREIFKEEFPRKNMLFGIVSSLLILFFLLNKEVFYNHLHQLIPFILVLSLIPLHLKIGEKARKIIVSVLIVFALSIFFQNLEAVARMYRDRQLDKQINVSSFIHENIPKNSTFFSDTPQYYFLSGFNPTNKSFLLAPSFNSVLDYSFLCSNNNSNVDFMLLTHRKKFLEPKIFSCIESNFKVVKKFENIGESYVEIWQKNGEKRTE